MTWHVEHEAAVRYADRRVDAASAASIEAHLLRCADCRSKVSVAVDPFVLDAVWADLTASLDQPATTRVERTLQRVGCSEATARTITATSRTSWAYLLAVGLSLALAVIASRSSDEAFFGTFLVFAPLGPLVATAAAFGRWADGAADLIDTVPTSSLRILLVRTTAAVVPAIVLTAASLPWLLDRGLLAAGWLLPSVALALGAIALSSWVRIELAAAALAFVWVSVPLVLRWRDADLLDLLRGPVQVLSVAIVVVAVIVTALRQTAFDYREAR